MHFDTQRIKSELNLSSFGQKGWLKNKSLCPFCGQSEKWGILFVKDSGIFNCFKGSCGAKTSLYNYLKQIERVDLASHEVQFSIDDPFPKIFEDEEDEEVFQIQEPKPIKGIQFIEDDEYLNSRGFLPEHYKYYKPAYTDSFLEKGLRNYIIFHIFQEGNLVSWLARSRYTKEWHQENLRLFKQDKALLSLRYKNSEGTEFGEILGGYDEITSNTHTVILVEGLFDKVGVDSKLQLFDDECVRCCFTFGNKITDSQNSLLRKKKNIKNIILLYDYGTVVQSKQYSMKLNKYFNTKVCRILTDSDPGDMSAEEIINTIEHALNPIEFFVKNLDMEEI